MLNKLKIAYIIASMSCKGFSEIIEDFRKLVMLINISEINSIKENKQ